VPDARAALDKLDSQRDIASAQVFGDRLHVWIDSGDRDAAARTMNAALHGAGLQTANVRPIVPSLEDVFIARLATANEASVS